MDFQEYLEDILDQSAGLMSAEQIAKARDDYKRLIAPKKTAADDAHPDVKKGVAELRARCERLISGQSGAILRARADHPAIPLARAAVEEGRALLKAKRPTKAQFITHAANNSSASRAFNAVK